MIGTLEMHTHMQSCRRRHASTHTHLFEDNFKVFFHGLLMCLFVFPQEIQPGDHHKALLGRKVSVCASGWVCVCPACAFASDVQTISPITGYTLKHLPPATEHDILKNSGAQTRRDTNHSTQNMTNTYCTYTHNHVTMSSPPFPSLHTLHQPSCQTATSHICFYCHVGVFCFQSALVTFPLFLKVLLRQVDAPPVHPHTSSGSLSKYLM